MTVDDINRPVSKAYLDAVEPTPDVAYAYDQAQYGIGLPYQTTNGEVTTTVIAYDEMGRQAELQKSITGADPRTMSWTYDYAGRVKRLTYPHTDTSPIFFVDYAFHSGTGLLHTTTGSDSTVYATMTGYQPNGKIGNMVFGNGATTNYGYDGWSERLTGIYTVAGGNDVQDRAYQYTAAGDIEGIDDSYNMESYYYSYDKLHRLRSETTSTGSVGVIPAIMDLAYDDPGHIHAVSQVTTRGQVYDYDYDLNGNQTAGPDLTDPLSVVERSLVFNADNMPVLVTHPNSGITSFVYDGNAKRAKKVGNGKTTYYYADEFELIDNVETHYVFAGNLRVAQVKNDQTTYFHKDHLGSSTAVTDVSGNVSASTMYMPFGGRRGEGAGIGTTDYLFTDQELDASTGLYNYDARLYDPVIGRFLSADSIVPEPFNPQAFNRYSYVLNNPLIYTDPTGHWFQGVESDPSSYDVDYGGTPPEEHVDYRDGDDPGERGWDHSDKDGWTKIIKAPGSQVGRKIDAFGNTLDHVLLPNDEVLPKTEYERAQDEFARSILRPFTDLSQSLGVKKSKFGTNTRANKQVDSIAKKHRMDQPTRHEFGDYIESRKALDGRGGADNYSYQELDNIAKEFLRNK